MTQPQVAKFGLGQIVRHRDAGFRGVVIDIDAVFAGPAVADLGDIRADQPFYQVLAIGSEGGFMAYAPESLLELDPELSALSRAAEARWFTVDGEGRHAPKTQAIH